MIINNDWDITNSKEYYKNVKNGSFKRSNTQLDKNNENKKKDLEIIENDYNKQMKEARDLFNEEQSNIIGDYDRRKVNLNGKEKEELRKERDERLEKARNVYEETKSKLKESRKQRIEDTIKIYGNRQDQINKDINGNPVAIQTQSKIPEGMTSTQNQPNVNLNINESNKQPEAINSSNPGNSGYDNNYNFVNNDIPDGTSGSTYDNTYDNNTYDNTYDNNSESNSKGKGNTVSMIVLVVLAVIGIACVAMFVKKYKSKKENIIKKTLNKKNANSNDSKLTPFPPFSTATNTTVSNNYQSYISSNTYPETNTNAASFMEHSVHSYAQQASDVNSTVPAQSTTVEIPYEQAYVTNNDTVALTSDVAYQHQNV